MFLPSEQLGVQPLDFADEIARYRKCEQERSSTDRPRKNAWCLQVYAEKAAEYAYLGGYWHVCAEWCQTTAEEGAFFLMGDWRQRQLTKEGKIEPDCWFAYPKSPEYWVAYLEGSLGWAGVGRFWEGVSTLLEFPTPRVGADGDGPAPRAYYLGLARWWRDRQDTAGLEEAKTVRGAGSKYYHLLCDIALAMTAGDKTSREKCFTKCVQHFLQRRDHEEHFPMAATFLWNVAKRDGLAVELPAEIAKFLFEIPDDYWEKGKPK